jgi:predicted Zn-dependent peptidase
MDATPSPFQAAPEPVVTILPNGLKVVATPLPHLSLTSVALFVRVGSRFETPSDSGLSHLLEHVLFRGSAAYPDTYGLNTAIEAVGTGLDAATSRDFTTFEATCLPTRVDQMLTILGDMITRPRFLGVDVERRIITEELQDELDQKGRDVDPDNLSKMSLFAGSSMGLKVGGLLSRVQRFDAEDCRRWHARHYTARNMVLAVTGPIEPAAIAKSAEAALGALPEGMLNVPPPPKIRSDLPAFEYTQHTGSQADVLLSWVLPAEDHADWPALSLAHRVLDDGTCARLRHRIVDQLGLAYHASADLETYDGLSILTIATQTRHSQVVPVVDAMMAVVEELSNDLVSDTELERMRSRLALELGAVRDSPSSTGYWHGLHHLYDAADGLASRWRRAFAVTPATLLGAVRTHLELRRAQLVVVGDVDPVGRATLRRRILARRGERSEPQTPQ